MWGGHLPGNAKRRNQMFNDLVHALSLAPTHEGRVERPTGEGLVGLPGEGAFIYIIFHVSEGTTGGQDSRVTAGRRPLVGGTIMAPATSQSHRAFAGRGRALPRPQYFARSTSNSTRPLPSYHAGLDHYHPLRVLRVPRHTTTAHKSVRESHPGGAIIVPPTRGLPGAELLYNVTRGGFVVPLAGNKRSRSEFLKVRAKYYIAEKGGRSDINLSAPRREHRIRKPTVCDSYQCTGRGTAY